MSVLWMRRHTPQLHVQLRKAGVVRRYLLRPCWHQGRGGGHYHQSHLRAKVRRVVIGRVTQGREGIKAAHLEANSLAFTTTNPHTGPARNKIARLPNITAAHPLPVLIILPPNAMIARFLTITPLSKTAAPLPRPIAKSSGREVAVMIYLPEDTVTLLPPLMTESFDRAADTATVALLPNATTTHLTLAARVRQEFMTVASLPDVTSLHPLFTARGREQEADAALLLDAIITVVLPPGATPLPPSEVNTLG